MGTPSWNINAGLTQYCSPWEMSLRFSLKCLFRNYSAPNLEFVFLVKQDWHWLNRFQALLWGGKKAVWWLWLSSVEEKRRNDLYYKMECLKERRKVILMNGSLTMVRWAEKTLVEPVQRWSILLNAHAICFLRLTDLSLNRSRLTVIKVRPRLFSFLETPLPTPPAHTHLALLAVPTTVISTVLLLSVYVSKRDKSTADWCHLGFPGNQIGKLGGGKGRIKPCDF